LLQRVASQQRVWTSLACCHKPTFWYTLGHTSHLPYNKGP
jgi:hypothetical protein